jgi:translation initiation factor 3 subunit G
MALPDPKVTTLSDGTKTIIEYRRRESDGKLVKVTRHVRMTLVRHKAKHAVAERTHWKKFGAAGNGKVSFDDGITSLGEEVFLKLGVNKVCCNSIYTYIY